MMNDDNEVVDQEVTMMDDEQVQQEIVIDKTQTLDDLEEWEGDDGEDEKDEMGAVEEGLETLSVQDDSSVRFRGHSDSVYSVHINPVNKDLAVSGGGDDKAYVWNTATGERLFAIEGHTDTINKVAFSCCGNFVAAASMDGSISVLNTADGSLVTKLEGPSEDIEFIQWHPKGPVIMAGSADSTVWMWTAKDGKCMQVFSGHVGAVICGSFSHDGKVLVTGSEDGSAIVWNPRSATPIHHFKGEAFHEAPINDIQVHPSQRLMITGSQDQTGTFASIDTGKVLLKFKGHTDSIESVGLCSSLQLATTGSLDHLAKVWDISTGQCRSTCQHDDGVVASQFGVDSPLLYTACLDRVARCWDSRNGAIVQEWRGHTDAMLTLSVSSDGSTVVTGSDDQTACVFRRSA